MKKLREYKTAFALMIVFFLLGVGLVLPVFSNKTGIDIIQEILSDSGGDAIGPLGDDPPLDNTSPAYHYWYAPENSMGISEMKEVNWSYFKQLFNEHFYKNARYKRYSYSDWTDGTQYLSLNKTWNESGFWKVDIILDIPVDLYSVNVSFGCDLPVLNYVEREGYEIWLNYTANATETYQIKFNWSDIAQIPNLEISKHRTNDKFWISFKRDDVSAGYYVFDPIFGSQTTSSNSKNIENQCRVGKFQIPDCGIADNITASVWSQTGNHGTKFVIYDGSDNLIALTDEGTTGTKTWYTFNFSGSPSLNASAWCYLGVMCESGSGSSYTYVVSTGGHGTWYDSMIYPTFSDPIVRILGDSGGLQAIYCSYTAYPNATYYFDDNSDSEVWTSLPARMSDGNEALYTRTGLDADVELLNSTNCSGTDLGTIKQVMIRCKGYYTQLSGGAFDIKLRPVFSGGDGDNHTFDAPETTGAWSEWFDITTDTNAPGTWSWSDITGLDCDVVSSEEGDATFAWCSKVEIKVYYEESSVSVNVSLPGPVDETTDVLTSTNKLCVNISDHTSWNISLYDDSDALVNYSSGAGGDGRKECDIDLYFKFNETYYWNVTATDGTNWDNKTYNFTTFNGSGFVSKGNNISTDNDAKDYGAVYTDKNGNIHATRGGNTSTPDLEIWTYNENHTEKFWRKHQGNLFSGSGSGTDISGTDSITIAIYDNQGVFAYTYDENSTGDLWLKGTADNSDTYRTVDVFDQNGTTWVVTGCFAEGMLIYEWNESTDSLIYNTTYDPGFVYDMWVDTDNYNKNYIFIGTGVGTRVATWNENGTGDLWVKDTESTLCFYGVWGDGNYIYYATNGGIRAFSFDESTETLTEEYVHSTGKQHWTIFGNEDYQFINVVETNANATYAYIYEGGSFIFQDKHNFGTIEYPRKYCWSGDYLISSHDDDGLYAFGFELLRVAPPVIDIIISGDPTQDSVTRDGVIRYVNQSYNNQTFCNVTANITVPDYRTMGRYFQTTDDDIFIPSGNLTDNDGDFNEKNHSLIATQWNCTYTGEYSQISGYLIGSGMSPPWVGYAMYTDSSDSPGTLLGFTERDWPGSDTFTETNREYGCLYYPPCTRVWFTGDISYNGTGASTNSITLTEGNKYWLVMATNDSAGYYSYNYSEDIYWLLGNSLGDVCHVKTAPYNISDDMNFSNVTSPTWSNHATAHYACIYAIANSTYNDVPTVDIASATLHWYNDSVNTWNMSMTQIGSTGNWTKNVTGLTSGTWYTFDIVAYDELADDVTYEHYRYLVEGTTEYIEFQCNIPYVDETAHQGYNSSSTLYRNDSVLYLENRTYGTDTWYGDDEHMEDALPHEQGVDGTADDTGGWVTGLPGDEFQVRHCLKFAGAWWDDNITIEDTVNLTNVYAHLWTGGGNVWDSERIHYGRMTTLYDFGWLELTGTVGVEWNYVELETNTSTITSTVISDLPEKVSDPSGVYNTTRLRCQYINISNTIGDSTFDSTSIYNFFIGFDNNGSIDWTDNNGDGRADQESAMILNNRSFLSFLIFNIPQDIFNGTNLSVDSDSDGLSDYYEMNVSFTHPFINDTDGDGYNDSYDGSPNNYLEYMGWRNDNSFSFSGDNVSNWNLNNSFSFQGNNITSWVNDKAFSFQGGNTTSWVNDKAFSFQGNNQSVPRLNNSFSFCGDNQSSWYNDKAFSFSGDNVTTWINTKSFSFSGDNTSSWYNDNSFSFSGDNQTTWYNTNSFSFQGNNSVQWTNTNSFSFSGNNLTAWFNDNSFSFSGGNTSGWSLDQSFSFQGGNTSSWYNDNSFSFSGNNLTSWVNDNAVSFSGGSVMTWVNDNSFSFAGNNLSTWSQDKAFSFGGNNLTTWENDNSFSFQGNNSVQWNNTKSFSFSGNNLTAWVNDNLFSFSGGNASQSILNNSFSFAGNNISTWSLNDSFSFSGGSTMAWSLTNSFSFSGNNETFVLTISNVYPGNETYVELLQPTVYFTLTDINGQVMNYTIYTGNSSENCTYVLDVGYNVSNGTYCYNNYTNATEYGTTYYWSVHVGDGDLWTNETYHFTLRLGGVSGRIISGGNTAGVIALASGSLLFFVVGLLVRRYKRNGNNRNGGGNNHY